MEYILNDKVKVTYLDNNSEVRTEKAEVIGKTFEANAHYDVKLIHNNYVIKNIKEKFLELD
jgi:hypothetical protein